MEKRIYSFFCFIAIFFSAFLLSNTKVSDSLDRFEGDKNHLIPEKLEDKFSFNNPENDAEVGKAMGAFDTMEKSNAWTERINPSELTQFPIGIKENLNSVEYALVVTKARFTPQYAIINVYARVVIPQMGAENGRKVLYFGAEEIKLTYSGSIVGDAKLSLLGDVNIPFNKNQWMLTLKGGKITKTGDSVSDTYVVIDCYGIKELSLKGNVEISRNVLVPLDSNGNVLEEGGENSFGKPIIHRVRGDFAIKVSDWNDILVKIKLTPFAITKQVTNNDKGYFSFLVHEAVLDLSDLRNDPSVVFPRYYMDNQLLIAGEQSWRGLYVQTLKVGLPEEFKKIGQNPKESISFEAQNLIIDNYGVSGMFSAHNLISLEEGITNEKNSWRYSLDKLGVDLAASKIVGANIAGKIQLPVQARDNVDAEDETKGIKYLSYLGLMTDEEYLIRVAIENDIDFNVWKAKATIEKGSAIEFHVKNREFLPRAILNGRLDINSKDSSSGEKTEKSKAEFKGIEFQNLVLQTKAPFITVDYFGMKGEHKLANFPVTIKDIQLVTSPTTADLQFGINVTLMDGGFSAEGSLEINGTIASDEGKRQQWKFKGLNISGLQLNNVDIGIARVSGRLSLMDDDPLYGDGFSAHLSAKINGLGETAIGMNATFGRSTFRYWGFEGSADGLRAGTGLFQISGFSGGVFYRMRPSAELTKENRGKAMVMIPDENIGLALRAGVSGSVVDPKTLEFIATFSISTHPSGGMAYLGFQGEGVVMGGMSSMVPDRLSTIKNKLVQAMEKPRFLEKLDKKIERVLDFSSDLKRGETDYPEDPGVFSEATVYARVGINYDFLNKIFHGTLDVSINTPGNLITGTGSGGRAGWAVIHVAPKEWYLHIGTPQDMIGLKVGLGSFRLRAEGYFMVGDKIPASPPPPYQVAQILGIDLKRLDYMRDLNQLSDGKGFAFGAHFSFDTGDLRALFLYARFAAGFGGDIMLKNYGEARCTNRGGSQIGMNGWYANGQAYLYLQGELGIRIRLFFIRKKIPIIKAGAAALLQVKAPNPFWMRGYLGGYFNLLGGLVKGRFRFKLEFGEECKLANESILGGMKIITDVSPKKGDAGVDVFAIPQATFSLRVNEPVIIPEDDRDHEYKVVLERFVVVDESGKEIEGTVRSERSADVLNFVSEEILPPNKKLKAIVEVSFQERINGIFQTLTVDGKKATEVEEREFTTGTAPNVIPISNVQYSYPVVSQENYYKDESSTGYIKLKRGQDYLFEDSAWKTLTVLKDADGKEYTTDFNYNFSGNEVSFAMPDVKQEKKYTLHILSKSSQKPGTTTNTKTEVSSTTKSDDSEDETEIDLSFREIQAQNIAKDGEIQRLEYGFRTSKYKTFKSKIKALSFDGRWEKITSDVIALQNAVNAKESFDTVELLGSEYTDNIPLISIEALMDDDMSKYFKSLLYDHYPIEGIRLDRDDEEQLIKIPPSNALPIFNSYMGYLENKVNHPFLLNYFPYKYNLFSYYKIDWYEMVSKASSKYVDTPTEQVSPLIKKLIESNFMAIPSGKYKAEAQYLLPGNKAGSKELIPYQYKH